MGVTPAPESVAPTEEKPGKNTTVLTGSEDQSDPKSDINEPIQAVSSHTFTRSVTVYWDIPTKPLSSTVVETAPSSSDSEHSQRPIPLPRTKSRKQAITEEVEDQTLVRLSDHSDSVQSDPEEVLSNKYLKELLEVFSADNECEENSDIVDTSDETLQEKDAGDKMSHSQRNIQARIQAFESQTSLAEGNEPPKPEPQPRKATNKPPVAAKPSVALKPQFNYSIDDDSQNVLSTNIPPTPAPKPQPPKKPMAMANRLSLKEELEALHNKVATPNRSRPPMLPRANSVYEDEPSLVPPTPPVKPYKEPLKPNLNINNHNSTSVFRENEYVNSPSSEYSNLCCIFMEDKSLFFSNAPF